MSKVGAMEDQYWMFGYDLPAETATARGLTEEQKVFLNTMRKDVWLTLRDFGCVPVQQSLWNIREPDKKVVWDGKEVSTLEAVRAAMAAWKKRYSEKGFDGINIDCWPMQTGPGGTNYILYQQMRFIFEAMMRAEKSVDEAIKEGKCKMRKYNELNMRCDDMRNMFVADFTVRHDRWTEFEQVFMRVKRKMEDRLSKMVT